MTTKPSEQALPLTRNLKRSFENAVSDIYRVGSSGKVSQYRSPIVQRAQSSSECYLNEEKRALADAAKALALLWKVAPNSSR